jgi:hypothetical protein
VRLPASLNLSGTRRRGTAGRRACAMGRLLAVEGASGCARLREHGKGARRSARWRPAIVPVCTHGRSYSLSSCHRPGHALPTGGGPAVPLPSSPVQPADADPVFRASARPRASVPTCGPIARRRGLQPRLASRRSHPGAGTVFRISRARPSEVPECGHASCRYARDLIPASAAPSPLAADPLPASGLACDATVRRPIGGPRPSTLRRRRSGGSPSTRTKARHPRRASRAVGRRNRGAG